LSRGNMAAVPAAASDVIDVKRNHHGLTSRCDARAAMKAVHT
jgi:hypothetical protein